MDHLDELLAGAGALIFDCDGTLVDTLPAYTRAWAEGFRPYAEMAPDWYLARAGLSEGVLVEAFGEVAGRPLDQAAVVRAMRDAFRASVPALREVGAVAAIARRFRGRLPMAVASGGSREIVGASLAATGLAPLFDAVVTFDDVGRAKPAPDLFLEAARRLGAVPGRCLVFEDSREGLEAASRAGMRAVDVATLTGG